MTNENTVFLVDDDPAVLDSTRCLLAGAGYNVEVYASATEYLEAYDPQNSGCLVLDLRMPEISGLQLQEKLVAIGEHMPIIFVTAHGDVPACSRAMKAGAYDFLEKPVDGQMLLQLVRRALDKDSATRSRNLELAEIAKRIESLTPREQQVMDLVYEGRSMKEMARDLKITFQTVAKHHASLLDNMQVDRDTELVRILIDLRRHEH